MNRYRLSTILFLGLAVLIVGCSNSQVGSIQITPASQSLVAGQTAQFTATGIIGHGNHPATNEDVTSQVTWASNAPAVATINSSGVATGVSAGTATISASMPGGLSATATVGVTGSVAKPADGLVSLSITPSSQTALGVNQTAAFVAIGTTSSGTNVNLTNQSIILGSNTIKPAVWASTISSVATINAATGIATALTSGTTTITASATNPDGTVVTASATLTVTISTPGAGEPLVSLAIVPGTQTLAAAGQSTQYIAIGTTASGTTVNLTNKAATIGTVTINAATWSSSSLAVATIDKATGLATSGNSGVTVITAMASNPDGTVVAATATLTVNITATQEPLVSLAIVPAAQQAFAINQTAHFIAIGTTSTGTTVNLTNQPATINGVVVGAAAWGSSNPAVASIGPATGIATALSVGSTAIVATATNPDGTFVTGTAAYTVTIPSVSETLVSMAIVPASQTLVLLGQTANLAAIATTGTGTTVNLTNQTATIGLVPIQPATWTSSNPGVATVNPGTGVVTGVTAGTTVIVAIASNPDGTVVTGVSTVTVTGTGGLGDIASMTVIPGSQAVQSPNATAQYIAIGTTTTGATKDLTQQVAWSSSSAQIGTIGASTGLATAVGQGTATMTAIYTPQGNGNVVTGTGTFTVVGGTTQQYTAISILPGSQSLPAGRTSQFIALATVGTTGFQQDVTNSPQIRWSSSVPSIASVSSTPGLVTGVTEGSATITAELQNPDNTVVSATAALTVSAASAPEPLLSLTIIPGAIAVGDLQDTGQFLAIGTFATAPYVQDLTNSPGTTWISSFPDSFPVSTNSGGTSSASAGIVTAYGTGTATIIAEYTNPDPAATDHTIQTATATFSCPLTLPDPNGHPPTPGSCYLGQTGPLKATLTVYGEGLNTTNWLITGDSATGTPDVIHCGPGWTANGNIGGSVCTGIYPIGSTVTLTAPAQNGVAFGGWTYNCTPTAAITAAGPNSCTISLGTTNATVGAIFNNP